MHKGGIQVLSACGVSLLITDHCNVEHEHRFVKHKSSCAKLMYDCSVSRLHVGFSNAGVSPWEEPGNPSGTDEIRSVENLTFFLCSMCPIA